ncbi:MAG TPA: hypothetical protein VHA52_01930 [Candidatus Babeliaceae bacterium]|nr:hypothetical protein [Candidatus Babeliaceae bacterium]
MIDLKIGSFIKLNDEVAELISIENQHNKFTFSTLHGDIIGTEKEFKIELIPIERKLLTACCGFDENGLLKIDINGRGFYLQEHAGYIILQDEGNTPLIYFWEVTQLHKLQLLYNGLSGTKLNLTIQMISDFFDHHAAMI